MATQGEGGRGAGLPAQGQGLWEKESAQVVLQSFSL